MNIIKRTTPVRTATWHYVSAPKPRQTSILSLSKSWGACPPQNSNYLLVLRYPVNRFQSLLDCHQFQDHILQKMFCANFTLHSISKVSLKIHFVPSIFYAKEEKANFKLENESQPNVRHFLTDLYIHTYIYTVQVTIY